MALRFYAPDERSGSADASKRLSERFGIPEQEVRKLLYGSGTQASAPAPTPTPVAAPPPPVQPPVIVPQPEHHWNPVSTLGALLGVIGILALAAAIVIIMRVQQHHEPMMGDMPPHHQMQAPVPEPPAPAPMPKDSCCQPSAAPADKPTTEETPAEEPKIEQPAAKKPTSRKPKAAATSSSAFRTSNSMEAEEKLAEMRADGHSKAKIRTIKKNGVILYEVK